MDFGPNQKIHALHLSIFFNDLPITHYDEQSDKQTIKEDFATFPFAFASEVESSNKKNKILLK